MPVKKTNSVSGETEKCTETDGSCKIRFWLYGRNFYGNPFVGAQLRVEPYAIGTKRTKWSCTINVRVSVTTNRSFTSVNSNAIIYRRFSGEKNRISRGTEIINISDATPKAVRIVFLEKNPERNNIWSAFGFDKTTHFIAFMAVLTFNSRPVPVYMFIRQVPYALFMFS